jgi:hypothetical protein
VRWGVGGSDLMYNISLLGIVTMNPPAQRIYPNLKIKNNLKSSFIALKFHPFLSSSSNV